MIAALRKRVLRAYIDPGMVPNLNPAKLPGQVVIGGVKT